MPRPDLNLVCRPGRLILGGLLLLSLAGLNWACQPGPAARTPFKPPPAEYQRRLRLVFEDEDFRPLAGVPVRVEFLEGRAWEPPPERTAPDGSLRLRIKPLMILGGAGAKSGDLFIDYRLGLRITLWPGQAGAAVFVWADQQSFAYYQDPLYAGQNRRPRAGEEIVNFILGPPPAGQP